jgi:hypothetical protein
MDQAPNLPPPDAEPRLRHDLQLQVAAGLRGILPPPVIDTPEAWLLRDRAALMRVATLLPANAVEADFAVHHVGAMAHARDCLEQLADCLSDPKRSDQLRAQSGQMANQAIGYYNKLEQAQAARNKREANDAAQESAAPAQQMIVLDAMIEAMESLPPGPPPRRLIQATAATAQAAEPPAPPVKLRVLRDYNDWSDEEKRVDRLRWEVDRYAILKTRHAKLIRQLGGLPPNCDFEPPPDEVLQQLIRRTDSNITWVDTWEPWVHPDLRVPPG